MTRGASGSRLPALLAPGAYLAAGAAVVPAVVPVTVLLVVGISSASTAGIPASRLLELLASTAILTAAVTPAAVAVGTATALLTTGTDLPGRRMWAALVTAPMVIPSYVGALAVLGAGGGNGVLTTALEAVGLGGLPPLRGFWPTWATLSLWNAPVVHLLVAPAVTRLDPALTEAARGLGASRLRVLRTVTLPQLLPAVTAGFLLVALYTISDFGAVSLLGYETFTRAIYTQLRGRVDPGPALFLAALLVGVALVLVAAFSRIGPGPAGDARSVRTAGPRPVRRRGAALTFLAGISGLSLGVPVLVLGAWLARGLQTGNQVGGLGAETVASLAAAGLGALAATAAAIPLAVLTVRHRTPIARSLEMLSLIPYSLPHLAVGFAFLITTLRLAPALYQTIPILLLAYVALFLPLAHGAVASGLARIPPRWEEASRSLGHPPRVGLRRVTLPLLAPSLAGGAGLVFLSVMKELPATLLLRPTGMETLAVRIWSSSSEGLYSQASTAALLLVAAALLPAGTVLAVRRLRLFGSP